MQLSEAVARDARARVQPVDVLADHARQLARLLQRHQKLHSSSVDLSKDHLLCD